MSHKCAACGALENLTIDHIKPVSRGGNNALENLQTLCYSCNQIKGDMTPEVWRSLIRLGEIKAPHVKFPPQTSFVQHWMKTIEPHLPALKLKLIAITRSKKVLEEHYLNYSDRYTAFVRKYRIPRLTRTQAHYLHDYLYYYGEEAFIRYNPLKWDTKIFETNLN